jgi:hypothetical protein
MVGSRLRIVRGQSDLRWKAFLQNSSQSKSTRGHWNQRLGSAAIHSFGMPSCSLQCDKE